MKIQPTLVEVKEIAASGHYNVLPVSLEILSDFTTPIETMKILKNVSVHSLAADADTIPECLKITALTTDKEVMAVQHKNYPIYGVQFHPESIMTPEGKKMLGNFIKEM